MNIHAAKLFPVLFIRLSMDGLAGVRFFFRGEFAHFWAVLRAHFWFYYKLFHFLRKRKGRQYKNYYKIKSIVYLYFIKKQMIFDENFNNSL